MLFQNSIYLYECAYLFYIRGIEKLVRQLEQNKKIKYVKYGVLANFI